MCVKISCIKTMHDVDSFRLLKGFGVTVYELEEPEWVDRKIRELVENRCNTIIISNEVAGFSEDIIKQYKNSDSVNIVIANSKREYQE